MLARYIHILQNEHILEAFEGPLVVVGHALKTHTIAITHSLIEDKIGIPVAKEQIKRILEGLGCTVTVLHEPNLHYSITIPTYRSVKDLLLPEDCIEEIARFIGFDAIQPQLPEIALQPGSLDAINRLRLVKTLCASLLRANEVRNYPVYDDSFLEILEWEPENAVRLKNPMASNQGRLVTSLVPNLLKNATQLVHEADTFALFEWNRVWHQDEKRATQIKEERKLIYMLIDAQKKVDFYAIKNDITSLFKRINLAIEFEKAVHPPVWYHPYKTAVLKSADKVVGFFGFIHPGYLEKIGRGEGFLMEIDGDWLINAQEAEMRFTPFSKYQASNRDISCLMPNKVTVQEAIDALKEVSPRITEIKLVDFFTKPEWQDARSLTFRITIKDQHKTLFKEEIDAIIESVIECIQGFGATIR